MRLPTRWLELILLNDGLACDRLPTAIAKGNLSAHRSSKDSALEGLSAVSEAG